MGIQKTTDSQWITDQIGSFILKLISKAIGPPLEIIHDTSSHGLSWNHGMKELIYQDFRVLACVNSITGLSPFMTLACIDKGDIDTLFEMIRSDPQVIK